MKPLEPPIPLFRDRYEAGRSLARKIADSACGADSLVLALPRGGVPVGFEVAELLPAELDLCLVRKLGLPSENELAFGAIASGGVRVLNYALVAAYQVSPQIIESITAREVRKLERREESYREGRPKADVRDRLVILTDDGLATGATMMAACRGLRLQGVERITVAVPVGSRSACNEVRAEVDALICLETPERFISVGEWYEDFAQISDTQVRDLLALAAFKLSDRTGGW